MSCQHRSLLECNLNRADSCICPCHGPLSSKEIEGIYLKISKLNSRVDVSEKTFNHEYQRDYLAASLITGNWGNPCFKCGLDLNDAIHKARQSITGNGMEEK